MDNFDHNNEVHLIPDEESTTTSEESATDDAALRVARKRRRIDRRCRPSQLDNGTAAAAAVTSTDASPPQTNPILLRAMIWMMSGTTEDPISLQQEREQFLTELAGATPEQRHVLMLAIQQMLWQGSMAINHNTDLVILSLCILQVIAQDTPVNQKFELLRLLSW